MELAELLDLNLDRIPVKDRPALDYIMRAWHADGDPCEPESLAQFLDEKLEFCKDVGYRYPKVLLLRLKQLQRGEWPRPGPQVSEGLRINPLANH